ncbi:DUF2599 domain-containing protein [Peribacillus sp. NPDC060253]|uniref:DUF2599 domain-containing protein n=1 Tax=Peribacillus sp. NPDC060253 TaxID=3347084 RepID=UPI003650847C
MKFISLKVLSVISILSLGFTGFSTSSYAESNSTVTNMEQLPYNLIEDVEVMDYQVQENNIVTETEDFTSNINLDKNEITYTDSEENSVAISIDDPDLKFVENVDGTIVYENEEDGYSVDNQILDGGFRQMFKIESESSPKIFICHAVNPLTIYKSPWNLEPWRPDLSLVLTYKNGCNPK